jgi:DNA-binding CsgD family transcriptional regulator
MVKHDWATTKKALTGRLSDEEERIVDMLIGGMSTVEIGRILGQHRSMIWRKTQQIRKRSERQDGGQ